MILIAAKYENLLGLIKGYYYIASGGVMNYKKTVITAQPGI